MILDLFILMMAFYLAIPLVAGYTAKAYGHSFWKWFLFTCLLPAVSYLILYIVITRDIRNNKLHSLLTQEEINYMDQEVKRLMAHKSDSTVKNQREN